MIIGRRIPARFDLSDEGRHKLGIDDLLREREQLAALSRPDDDPPITLVPEDGEAERSAGVGEILQLEGALEEAPTP